MNICCPHCLVPFESDGESSWSSIGCPSCGKNFSLSGTETTASYQPGTQVMGRFELLHVVGSGRFGSVWKARDTQLQRTVAVKIPRQGELDPHETELFLRDARAAAQLRHPRIVGVHEVGREYQTVYIVTDFIDGANLAEWLSGRRLSTREAAELVIEVAEALHHAHEAGVVHRDVKPGNIMMDRDGRPYVIDFGLARREAGEMTVTVEGQVLGTPAYMPPEQARGEGHRADRRSDIYSLGAILFKLLTGELPFRGDARMLLVQILDEEPPSPRKLNADVPRDLETITLKCLEKDPAKRYQTARALADDLRRFLTGEPILARPVGYVERAWRWSKRHSAVASLSASLLLLLLTVSVIAPIVAVRQAQLRREYQNQVAHNLFQRAVEEYESGRILEGIALLAGAHEVAGESSLADSIRRLMSGWSQQAGRPIVHDGAVLAVAISPDGTSALVGGHNRKAVARLWDLQTLTPFGEPLQHGGSIRAVGFSPDGRLALTGSHDETARLWNAKTGTPVGKPFKNEGEVWAACFSPDGTMLATGGMAGSVKLWNAETGDELATPIHHQRNVLTIAFSPDSRIVVSGSYDEMMQFWDTELKQSVGTPVDLQKPVYAVAFSSDGSKMLVASAPRDAQLWDAKTRQPLGESLQHENVVYAAALGSDGRMVMTGSFDNTARLWDLESGQAVGEPLRHAGKVMSVALSRDGHVAMTGSADGTARVWSIRDGRILQHQGLINAVTFSRDGSRVLTAGDDKTARIWDTRTGQPIGEPLPHDGAVLAIAIDSTGEKILTGGDDRRIRLWNAQTGKPEGSPGELGGAIQSIDFCSDGKNALVHCQDDTSQTVQLWNLSTGQASSAPLRFDLSEIVLARSPDGQAILVGSKMEPARRAARVWDVPTGKARGLPLQHNAKIKDSVFSPDGQMVVTAGWDQEVRRWDARTGAAIGNAFRHEGIVYTVAIGDDGRTILSGSDDQTARLWDAQTGLPLAPPLQHADGVSASALSADGRLAVTIRDDGVAQLWDVASGIPMSRPLQFELSNDGKALMMTDAVFSPDDSAILFRCSDGTARLYDVPQPLPDKPELIRVWARARSGYRIDRQSSPRQLTQGEWLEAQQELIALESQ